MGAAIGSKDIVVKILGPTADYVGAGLKEWTERRVNNVGRIFQNAHKKLGDREEEEGSVHPKVLKEIFAEGSFAEDELAAEYFGGVLTSSRTGVPRDDRGAAFARLTAQLTTYQLRSHFFFYHLFKLIHNGSAHPISTTEGRLLLNIFIPLQSYGVALQLTPEENFEAIAQHVLFGLSREGLIEDEFRMGNEELIRQSFPEAEGPGLLITPSALGVELFHWAHGLGHLPIADFLKPETTFRSDIKIPTRPGFRATSGGNPART